MYCTVYCVKLPSPPSPSYVYLVLSCHESQLMDRTQPDRKETAAHANGAGLLWGAFVHRGFCFVQSRLVPLRICSRTISPPPTSLPFTVHLVPTIKLHHSDFPLVLSVMKFDVVNSEQQWPRTRRRNRPWTSSTRSTVGGSRSSCWRRATTRTLRRAQVWFIGYPLYSVLRTMRSRINNCWIRNPYPYQMIRIRIQQKSLKP